MHILPKPTYRIFFLT